MKKLLCVIPLAVLLCFAFACRDKAEKAELEKFRAQAKVEEQNKEIVKRFFEEWNKGNIEIADELYAPEYSCVRARPASVAVQDMAHETANRFCERLPFLV